MAKTKKNRNVGTKYKAINFNYLLGKVKGIDDNLMKIHFKLYEELVNGTNASLAQLKSMEKNGVKNMIEYSSIQKQLPFFFNGMRLHELYFGVMCGENMNKMSPELSEALNNNFGSFEKWKKNFMSTGDVPGVGFACLMRDRQNNKLYNTWINEFNIGELIEVDILLVMDMWEHAYLCEFGLNLKKYQETFLKNVNWSVVSNAFSKK